MFQFYYSLLTPFKLCRKDNNTVRVDCRFSLMSGILDVRISGLRCRGRGERWRRGFVPHTKCAFVNTKITFSNSTCTFVHYWWCVMQAMLIKNTQYKLFKNANAPPPRSPLNGLFQSCSSGIDASRFSRTHGWCSRWVCVRMLKP